LDFSHLVKKNVVFLFDNKRSLLSFFPFGSVFLSKDGYYTYHVSSKNDLICLINIFNGNLLLQKTNKRFEIFVKEFNKHYNTNIIVYPPLNFKELNKEWLFNNAWLSGFTDADGSFYIKLTSASDRPLGRRLRLGWYIDQSFEHLFIHHLKTILTYGSIQTKNNNNLRFKVDSFKRLQEIEIYFDKFPPNTIKLSIRFLRFKKIYSFTKEKSWKYNLSIIEHFIFLNKNEIYIYIII